MKLFAMLTTLVGFLSQRTNVYQPVNSSSVESTAVFPTVIETGINSTLPECGFSFDANQPNPAFAFSTTHTKTTANFTIDQNENSNEMTETSFLTTIIAKISGAFSWMRNAIQPQPATPATGFQKLIKDIGTELMKQQLITAGAFVAGPILLGAGLAYVATSTAPQAYLGLAAFEVVILSGIAIWKYKQYRQNTQNNQNQQTDRVEKQKNTVETEMETTPGVKPDVAPAVSLVTAEQEAAEIALENAPKVFAPGFEAQPSSEQLPKTPKQSVLEQAEAARQNSINQAEARLETAREAVESGYRSIIPQK